MEEPEKAREKNTSNSDTGNQLTQSQRERIAANRNKALALRKGRLRQAPYPQHAQQHSTAVRVFEDTKAGFLLEGSDIESGRSWDRIHGGPAHQDDGPLLPDSMITCDECGRRFAESYLLGKFNLKVCDHCRDSEDKHSLITKTEAKEKWLLKDCDFGERGGPPLSFIVKQNPHSSWGDMKLYLRCQVRERAYRVWGGEEELEAEKQRRMAAKEKKEVKKYAKQVRDLRRVVYADSSRSSSSRSHQHSFTSEQYHTSTDTWTKTCVECGHTVSFEKM